MRNFSFEPDKLKTQTQSKDTSKPKSLQFRMSSGMNFDFVKHLKLPSINKNPQPSIVSSRTQKTRSHLGTYKTPNHIKLQKQIFGETLNNKDFDILNYSKLSKDHVLNSVREESMKKSKAKQSIKPKVKKIFPDLNETISKEYIQEVNRTKYQVVSKIGEGNYAVVYKALFQNEAYAIKIYSKVRINNNALQLKNVEEEIKCLKMLGHVNIIKFIESFETTQSINIVTEYFPGRTLFSFLKAKGKELKNQEIKIVFKQIVVGLKYAHKKDICHRDIKLENILIDEGLNIKLIDFGFAVQKKDNEKITQICGTKSYMAPELLLKQPYEGKKIDIWALGVIFYKLIVGHLPFKGIGDKTVSEKIIEGKYKVPCDLDPSALSLISVMLAYDPESRITAKQILKHPYFLS